MDNGSARWKRIGDSLISKQREIDSQLSTLIRNNFIKEDSLAETLEDGFISWQDEMKANIQVTQRNLQTLSLKIKDSLLRLRSGTYGTCEKCGRFISPERLDALPMANLCIVCA